MIINFTGSVEIETSVYKELAEEDNQVWEEMSDKEKIEFVKEVEAESGNEFLTDARPKDISITSVSLD